MRAQGVNVRCGPGIPGVALGLLRGHVFGGADEQAAEGLVGRTRQDLGHPEVAELELPLGGHQHVGWLEVAMHDALPVSIMDRPGQRQEPFRGPVGGLGLAASRVLRFPPSTYSSVK